ncbi:MAG: ribonuclease III domain-containing protein [Hymenobacter sp.]
MSTGASRCPGERLEFLGDAVLELIITDHLYRTYPDPEGELTSWRSGAGARRHAQRVVAGELGVGEALPDEQGRRRARRGT